MKVLVLNAGSSSHKLCLYQLLDPSPVEPIAPLWKAQIDWYPQHDAATAANLVVWTRKGGEQVQNFTEVSRLTVLTDALQTLWQEPFPVIQSLNEIDAVGHRVVHGGAQYQSSVVITQGVKQAIANLSDLAPVHNPVNLEGIELMEQLLKTATHPIPQVAVFDTAFHSTLPQVAQIYPGPYTWYEQGIRRYGFHGISHGYCAQRAAQLLSRRDLGLIVCHLGNGGSLAAIRNGQSVNTTMGFTPLDGLMMGTRCGAVDPGILLYCLRQGMSPVELDHLLNHESGLKGISGVSHDLRAIDSAIDQQNQRAQLAQDLYIHRLKSCLGSMLISLAGSDGLRLDALVFTGGIGEHHAAIRATICGAMAFLGVELDVEKNHSNPMDIDIAHPRSKLRVLVIQAREDWAIATQVVQLLQTI